MKQVLLLLALMIPLNLFAQKQIDKNIYLTGDIKEQIKGNALLNFVEADEKVQAHFVKQLEDRGIKVVLHSDLFSPWKIYSEKERLSIMAKHHVRSMVVVSVKDMSEAPNKKKEEEAKAAEEATIIASADNNDPMGFMNEAKVSKTNKKGVQKVNIAQLEKAMNEATAFGASDKANAKYVSSVSLELEVFAKDNNYESPKATLSGKLAPTFAGFSNSANMVKKLLKKMVNSIDKQKGFK